MREASVTIVNRLGMHARPAALFVKTADRYRAEIWVGKDELEVNGKSIMGVMMLAAEPGSSLRIKAEGPDEAEALEALSRLVADKFNED
ncbi:MAG TPA: HPr family phosphocarrier protein [candidate division Zixibacteria bacterium]|jgi:phosphocarrier protein|nr:HPr family phosphocarrier protein [candidate division Zixibacteria bacterium]